MRKLRLLPKIGKTIFRRDSCFYSITFLYVDGFTLIMEHPDYPLKLEAVGLVVGTSTGRAELDNNPRFDMELSGIGRVSLITSDKDYAQWGSHSLENVIPFWNPIEDGEHHIVARRRDDSGYAVMTRPIGENKSSSLIPVYDLERIALNVPFPETIDTDGQLQMFCGRETDKARAYYTGQHLYGIKLDSGGKFLVAGEGLDLNCGETIHVVAKKSGRVDRIARPIYLAELLTKVRDAA